MSTEQRLREILEKLDLHQPKIDVHRQSGSKVFAEIVSDSFENMPELDRQLLVWDALLKQLPEREQRLVEFVFTDAPSELVENENGDTDAES